MLPATRWKPQSPHFSSKRGRCCLVALWFFANEKIGKQMACLPWVKCSLSHPLCIYQVAMSASSDALEASIGVQRVTKEGGVALSPSPLGKKKIGKQVVLEALIAA